MADMEVRLSKHHQDFAAKDDRKYEQEQQSGWSVGKPLLPESVIDHPFISISRKRECFTMIFLPFLLQRILNNDHGSTINLTNHNQVHHMEDALSGLIESLGVTYSNVPTGFYLVSDLLFDATPSLLTHFSAFLRPYRNYDDVITAHRGYYGSTSHYTDLGGHFSYAIP